MHISPEEKIRIDAQIAFEKRLMGRRARLQAHINQLIKKKREEEAKWPWWKKLFKFVWKWGWRSFLWLVLPAVLIGLVVVGAMLVMVANIDSSAKSVSSSDLIRNNIYQSSPHTQTVCEAVSGGGSTTTSATEAVDPATNQFVPSGYPTTGRITRIWDVTVPEWNGEHHEGVDIASSTEVYSTMDGVVFARQDSFGCSGGVCPVPAKKDRGLEDTSYVNNNYGHMVRIASRDDLSSPGFITLYAHLAAINKEIIVGRSIKRNDFIGIAGDTGYSIGKHLHYSVSSIKVRAWPYDNPQSYWDDKWTESDIASGRAKAHANQGVVHCKIEVSKSAATTSDIIESSLAASGQSPKTINFIRALIYSLSDAPPEQWKVGANGEAGVLYIPPADARRIGLSVPSYTGTECVNTAGVVASQPMTSTIGCKVGSDERFDIGRSIQSLSGYLKNMGTPYDIQMVAKYLLGDHYSQITDAGALAQGVQTCSDSLALGGVPNPNAACQTLSRVSAQLSRLGDFATPVVVGGTNVSDISKTVLNY